MLKISALFNNELRELASCLGLKMLITHYQK